MNTLLKPTFALSVLSAALLITPLASHATDAILKVKTVEQVKVTQKTPIELGTIPATAGYVCSVPQRLEATPPGSIVLTDTSTNTFTINDVTSFPGVARCGGNATPGLFYLEGVKGQNVTISFGTITDENSVGTFRPEGIFEASLAHGTDLTKTDITTTNTGAAPNDAAVQAAADEKLTAQYTQIFSQKTVTLNATSGLGMLRVGGTLEIDQALEADQTYSINYVVNVVYN